MKEVSNASSKKPLLRFEYDRGFEKAFSTISTYSLNITKPSVLNLDSMGRKVFTLVPADKNQIISNYKVFDLSNNVISEFRDEVYEALSTASIDMSKFEDTSISYDLKNRIIKKDLASGGSILNRYSSHYTVNLGAEGELNVAIKDSFGRLCKTQLYIKVLQSP